MTKSVPSLRDFVMPDAGRDLHQLEAMIFAYARAHDPMHQTNQGDPNMNTVTTSAEARNAMLDMVQLNGIDTVRAWVCNAMNCGQADIDKEGGVWIAEPQQGHWISPRALVDLVNRLNEGV